MTTRTEKIYRQRLVWLNVVFFSLIIVPTILIQVCFDPEIRKFNDDSLNLEIRRSHLLQMGNYQESRIQYWELVGLVGGLGAPGKQLSVGEDPFIRREDDPEGAALLAKHRAGELSSLEYAHRMGDLARGEKLKYANELKQIPDRIKERQTHRPAAFWLRVLCGIVQLIALPILLTLHLRLLMTIVESRV